MTEEDQGPGGRRASGTAHRHGGVRTLAGKVTSRLRFKELVGEFQGKGRGCGKKKG